ncbi:MAG: hypothetical protein IPJ67_05400 [Candidatus Moraniibacteriota bacterium]|nr:MAG: hypothetical protein IPJ67_05400 [Candidatus Moranbacteria bacterium]
MPRSITTSITDTDISTAAEIAIDPAYFVRMTCSIQGGGWKCRCQGYNVFKLLLAGAGAGL